jgi:hypothetical protein
MPAELTQLIQVAVSILTGLALYGAISLRLDRVESKIDALVIQKADARDVRDLSMRVAMVDNKGKTR